MGTAGGGQPSRLVLAGRNAAQHTPPSDLNRKDPRSHHVLPLSCSLALIALRGEGGIRLPSSIKEEEGM